MMANWIIKNLAEEMGTGYDVCACPKCGFQIGIENNDYFDFNFCPKCGQLLGIKRPAYLAVTKRTGQVLWMRWKEKNLPELFAVRDRGDGKINYVDKDMVLHWVQRLRTKTLEDKDPDAERMVRVCYLLEAMVNDLPASDVVREKEGGWVECSTVSGEDAFVCTECGYATDRYTDYCPGCGARMEDDNV